LRRNYLREEALKVLLIAREHPSQSIRTGGHFLSLSQTDRATDPLQLPDNVLMGDPGTEEKRG
jgi:hypothetical protein